MDLSVVAARTSKGGVRAGAALNVVAGICFSVVAASLGWLRSHKRWALRWALVVAGLRLLHGWGVVAGGGWLVALLVGVFPALVAGVWSTCWPFNYERRCAGPLRRMMWRRWVRKNWRSVSRAVGLSVSSQSKRRVWSWGDKRDKGFGLSQTQIVTRWSDSRLCSVTTAGQVLVLLVRARRGSKAGEVIAKAEEIAADVPGAHSARTRKISPSTAELRLVMCDVLEGIRDSADPATAEVRNAAAGSAGVGVVIGRAEDGTPVVVDLVADASHSALQGQTRSGKSALSYGILGSYAHRPEVLVCGVDPSGILLGPFTAGRGGAWIATGTADLAQAVAALAGVVAEMDARIATLADFGLDKIETFTPALPVLLVVLEEYPGLIAAAKAEDDAHDRKGAARVAPQIVRLVGRLFKESAKVGGRVMILAQRMSSNAVDTDDRSNFGLRATLRVDNGDAVKMLHDGADKSLIDEIRQFPAGMGLIESPGRPLMRFRADYTTYKKYLTRVSTGIAATSSCGGFTPGPARASTPIHSVANHIQNVQDIPGLSRPRAPRAPRAARAPRKPRTGGEAA